MTDLRRRFTPALAALSLILGLLASASPAAAQGPAPDLRSGSDRLEREAQLLAKGAALPDFDSRSGTKASLAGGQVRSAQGLELAAGTVVRFGVTTGGVSQVYRMGGYLSVPSRAPASAIIRGFLLRNRSLFRLSQAEIASFGTPLVDRDKYGAIHLSYQQRIGGRQVFGSVLKAHVDRLGRVIAIESSYTPGTVAPNAPKVIGARQAVIAALRSSMPDLLKKGATHAAATGSAGSLATAGTAYAFPSVEQAARGIEQATVFGKGPLTERIRVKQVIFPTVNGPVLAWQVLASALDRQAAYVLVVDASNGKLLYRTNLVRNDTPNASIFPKDPDATPLTVVPYDGSAATSPQGWHLEVPGGGHATIGNNVQADVATSSSDFVYPFTDAWKTTGPNSFDLAGVRLRYTPTDALATGYTLAASAAGSTAPAGTNLLPFYSNTDDGTINLICGGGWTGNILGATFTSFWVNTNGSVSFGAGITDSFPAKVSFSNDTRRVAALWRDLNPGGGGTLTGDCAPEGGGQRIRVVWNGVPNFPSGGSHTFAIVVHGIGTGLDNIIDVDYGAISSPIGELVGVGGNSGTPFVADTTGVVSYRDLSAGAAPGIRGGIAQTFPDQDLNLSITNLGYQLNWMHDYTYGLGFDEAAGNYQTSNFSKGGAQHDPMQAEAQYGLGTYNNDFFTFAPDGTPGFTFYGLFDTGAGSCRRDSAFDAGIIRHESMHGVTSRMVGGPGNVSTLSSFQGGALGEGWSDAFALTTLGDPVLGAYVTCSPGGMRSAPYDTNTSNYRDLGNREGPSAAGIGSVFQPEVHIDGEIWAATAWDIHVALGEPLTTQLLFDGLRYTPIEPSMVDARDAVLLADQVDYNGVHTAALWSIFAARGLGASAASQQGSFDAQPLLSGWDSTVYAAYDTPATRYTVAPTAVAFFDDFEGPNLGWTVNGIDGAGGGPLWHLSSRQASSGTKAYYYGKEATGDYNTGFRNYGDLVSPPISVPALASGETVALEFDHRRQTGDAFFFDGGFVRVIDQTTGKTTQIAFSQNTRTSFGSTNFEHQKVDLSRFGGDTIQVEFYMDTFDTIANNAEGWYIDNVKVATFGPPPTISIDDVSHIEGNAGTTAYTFTVSLSAANPAGASVDYKTSGGTATAPSDYTAIPTTTLTFGPAETSKTVTVLVNGDTLFEPTETFAVDLSNPSGATIADDKGVGTITNDEAAPTLSIDNVSHSEGNSGTTTYAFTVTRSGDLGGTSKVDYKTTNGSATAPSDYTAVGTTTLTFAPSEASKIITINVNGDTVVEPNETFAVDLSNPVGATIADGHGAGIIVNDDSPPPPPPPPVPMASVSSVHHLEGDSGTTAYVFTVSLSIPTTVTVTVDYQTLDGTALASTDYTAVPPTTLTFTPGQTSKTFTVLVNGDVKYEHTERFSVHLSNAHNTALSDTDGIGRIINDDAKPTFAINDQTAIQRAGTTMVFTVTKAGPTDLSSMVTYETRQGTARQGIDYVEQHGVLTFARGQTTRTITITILQDPAHEPSESFTILLSSPVDAAISRAIGRGTLRE